jgi:hypothetical protein
MMQLKAIVARQITATAGAETPAPPAEDA